MKSSMFRLIFIRIALILFITFAAAVIVGRFAVEKYYVSIKAAELKPEIQQIARDIGTLGHSDAVLNQFPAIIKAYDTLKNEMHVFTAPFVPVDLDGDGSAAFVDDAIRQAVLPYMDSVLMGNELSKIVKLETLSANSVIIGIPIRSNGQIIGGAFLIKPVSDFSSALNGFYMTFLLSSLLVYILVLALVYASLRRIISPIDRMTHSSNAMARGDYTLRIAETGLGEVDQLGHSLNTLAQALELSTHQAEKLEQTRRDYVANISHELRTPISSIRAMSETLCDRMVSDEDEKQRYHHRILQESIRLQRLINDMLELSRLQSGNSAMVKTVIDTATLLLNIYHRFMPLADDLGLSLELSDACSQVPASYTNRDRIEQVLIILLDNAMKFSPESGIITMDALWDHEQITLRVTDMGSGIAPHDLPFVFDRFYKADQSRSSQGTGLGLAIAHQIMIHLGETLGVTSTIGEGTCFYFTLSRNP